MKKSQVFSDVVLTLSLVVVAASSASASEELQFVGVGDGSKDPTPERIIKDDGKFGIVLDEVEKFAGNSAEFSEALQNIGFLLARHKNYEDAEKVLTKALKLADADNYGDVVSQVNCLSALADLYYRWGKYDKTKKYSEDCINLCLEKWNKIFKYKPVEYAGYLKQRGIIETHSKDYANAEKYYKLAVSVMPKDAAHLRGLGDIKRSFAWSYGQQKRYDDCIRETMETVALYDEADGDDRRFNAGDLALHELIVLLDCAGQTDKVKTYRDIFQERHYKYNGKPPANVLNKP